MSTQHLACWGPGSWLNQTKHPKLPFPPLSQETPICCLIAYYDFYPPVSSSIILCERTLTAKGFMHQPPSSTPPLLAVQTWLLCVSSRGNSAQQRSHHLCSRRIKHRNSFCSEASSGPTTLSDFKRWPNLSLLHKSRMYFLSPLQQIWQHRKQSR